MAALKLVHTVEHLRTVQGMSQTGGGFDTDTYWYVKAPLPALTHTRSIDTSMDVCLPSQRSWFLGGHAGWHTRLDASHLPRRRRRRARRRVMPAGRAPRDA